MFFGLLFLSIYSFWTIITYMQSSYKIKLTCNKILSSPSVLAFKTFFNIKGYLVSLCIGIDKLSINVCLFIMFRLSHH